MIVSLSSSLESFPRLKITFWLLTVSFTASLFDWTREIHEIFREEERLPSEKMLTKIWKFREGISMCSHCLTSNSKVCSFQTAIRNLAALRTNPAEDFAAQAVKQKQSCPNATDHVTLQPSSSPEASFIFVWRWEAASCYLHSLHGVGTYGAPWFAPAPLLASDWLPLLLLTTLSTCRVQEIETWAEKTVQFRSPHRTPCVCTEASARVSSSLPQPLPPSWPCLKIAIGAETPAFTGLLPSTSIVSFATRRPRVPPTAVAPSCVNAAASRAPKIRRRTSTTPCRPTTAPRATRSRRRGRRRSSCSTGPRRPLSTASSFWRRAPMCSAAGNTKSAVLIPQPFWFRFALNFGLDLHLPPKRRDEILRICSRREEFDLNLKESANLNSNEGNGKNWGSNKIFGRSWDIYGTLKLDNWYFANLP